jgi:hypothetical protein
LFAFFAILIEASISSAGSIKKILKNIRRNFILPKSLFQSIQKDNLELLLAEISSGQRVPSAAAHGVGPGVA